MSKRLNTFVIIAVTIAIYTLLVISITCRCYSESSNQIKSENTTSDVVYNADILDNNNIEKAKADGTKGCLIRINNSYLAYDIDTKIVYYVFSKGYKGYMSPYYSENGNLYKYNGEGLVELSD